MNKDKGDFNLVFDCSLWRIQYDDLMAPTVRNYDIWESRIVLTVLVITNCFDHAKICLSSMNDDLAIVYIS